MRYFVLQTCAAMPKIHHTRFPVTSPLTGTLATCYGLVSDTANKLATSRCNGIWETTRHNRHNGLLPAPTCYGLVTDLWFMSGTPSHWPCGTDFSGLSTCGFNGHGKADEHPTYAPYWGMVHFTFYLLWTCYGETGVMDFGLKQSSIQGRGLCICLFVIFL